MKYVLVFISLVLLMTGCSTVAVSDNNNGTTTILNKNTNPVITEDFLYQIAQGKVEGASIIYKFGAGEVDTSIHPITQSEIYMTPTTAQSLEFVSSSILDTYLSTGARQITIIGLNSSWDEVTQVINTSGTTPVQIPIPLTRLYRWYVSSSGTYATSVTGSHNGVLTIRESGIGDTWSIIPITPFPIGQSQISVFTIPKGKTGYLLSKNIFTDATKVVDMYMFQRCGLDDTVSPYSGTMRLIEREIGVHGGFSISFRGGKGPFVGPCDVGFMGEIDVGTAQVSTEFEMVLLNS